MRYAILLIVTCFFCQKNFSQYENAQLSRIESLKNENERAIIDTVAVNAWVRLGQDIEITNDGKYFYYFILGQSLNGGKLIIQSIDNTWKKEFNGASNPFFTGDNKQIVFLLKNTLYVLNLGTDILITEKDIQSVKHPSSDNGTWIAWLLNGSDKVLIVKNLVTNKDFRFISVLDYSFSNNGNVLLIKDEVKGRQEIRWNLKWLDLEKDSLDVIYSSENSNTKLERTNFDNIGQQLIFTTKDNDNNRSLYYYRKGFEKAKLKVYKDSPGMAKGMEIQQNVKFSNDGEFIYIQIAPSNNFKSKIINSVKVDVWSHNDTILQSTQLINLEKGLNRFIAVIATEGDTLIRLENDFEKVDAYPQRGEYVVVSYNPAGDKFWIDDLSNSSIATKWLVSQRTGKRELLNIKRRTPFYFSPSGKYVVYFDSKKNEYNYKSYDLSTGKINNISKKLPYGLLAYKDEYNINGNFAGNVGIAGWLENDIGLLVYDNYDIWLLDPSGKTDPMNITNGYGIKQRIKFRITNRNPENSSIYKVNEKLLLTAFHSKEKTNGFYSKVINQKGNPIKLVMGPWTFCHQGPYLLPLNSGEFDNFGGMKPLKAKSADVWIVKRASGVDAPNYFSTTDFKKFTSLTNIQPQQDYNWLKPEMIKWEQPDKRINQGILYKPENFDPNKKYPLIIYYYTQFSHRIYEYPVPDLMHAAHINIPWFVSRGYLVFTPDIYFEETNPGLSAFNSVVSGAKYLSKKSYVNAKKIAICGHSFAGGLTNYIVTHSNLFAAAISGAGNSNTVSNSLQLDDEGFSRLGDYERSLGASMWDRPDLYIPVSPLLSANKVTSPILIFHCKNDGAVPWEQGVEFFTALRRLGKNVWMLQYDGEDHTLVNRNTRLDFTIRVTQFLDHYLKNNLAPIWMTHGIRASLKGIESGLNLDPSGRCGDNCPVCKKIHYKIEHLDRIQNN